MGLILLFIIGNRGRIFRGLLILLGIVLVYSHLNLQYRESNSVFLYCWQDYQYENLQFYYYTWVSDQAQVHSQNHPQQQLSTSRKNHHNEKSVPNAPHTSNFQTKSHRVYLYLSIVLHGNLSHRIDLRIACSRVHFLLFRGDSKKKIAWLFYCSVCFWGFPEFGYFW